MSAISHVKHGLATWFSLAPPLSIHSMNVRRAARSQLHSDGSWMRCSWVFGACGIPGRPFHEKCLNGLQRRYILVKAVQPGIGEAPPETLDQVHCSGELIAEKEILATSESTDRIVNSMELLEVYSEEAHPGHQPGRFEGPGHEYDGMIHDGMRWHMKPAELGGDSADMALARLNEDDRALAIKFEAEGGLALCLANAFRLPEKLRREAKGVLEALEDNGPRDNLPDLRELFDISKNELQSAGFGDALDLLKGDSPMEQALVVLHAAGIMEEREAVMRNVWSDVEFHAGDAGNAELVEHMEMQFARQLVHSMRTQGNTKKTDSEEVKHCASHAIAEERSVFDMVLHGSSVDGGMVRPLEQGVSESEISNTLKEPKNLGVALDLVGAYLKNYEIDKADLLISRTVPLCRERGGTWLVKALDKLSAVRMKQFRAHDALVALKEIERVVPFTPEEGWEFHDILYRNFAWCYSSLDEPERCLEYTRKSVEVKRNSGIAATWFDIWDLGKNHARLGQKTKQQDEMRMGYDLCVKAADLHRKAEPSDKVMLAKILSNVGEVAMGIGDSYKLQDDDARANDWYIKAENPLCESYNLHSGALGPMKPLSGWAAGTVAHCMVRLGRLADASEYLSAALKVECTKDSTTPGSVIELLERVMSCQNELQDLKGMRKHVDELEFCLGGLRARGWDRKERDVFSLLLQKVSMAILVADEGSGTMIARALKLLREAESSLVIHLSHIKSDAIRSDGVHKQFGPRADPTELLCEVRKNIKILSFGDRAADSTDGDMSHWDTENVPASHDAIEPLSISRAHKYALVGNWDGWASFIDLARVDAEGDEGFEANVAVPGGKVIEFQILRDHDWNQRFVPGVNGTNILGPSSAGHGQNWHTRSPAVPSVLCLKFDPRGRPKLEYWLEPSDS